MCLVLQTFEEEKKEDGIDDDDDNEDNDEIANIKADGWCPLIFISILTQ